MGQKKRGVDRRLSTRPVTFPLTLASGEILKADRRQGGDRREHGFLVSQPLFRGLPYSIIEPLIEHCELYELEQGEQLLAPGQENHYLFLILRGLLKVHIKSVDSEEGFYIGPGECVGEISIIDGMKSTAFVVAEESSRLLAIPERALWTKFLQIPSIAQNFMQQLAARFRSRNSAMQRALEEQLKLEHLQKELAIAREIQANLLASHNLQIPIHSDVDISARMTPAKELGGDFFDVFAVDDHRICIAIGDVAGKGVPAALFMVRAMTLLRSEMMRYESLPDVMRHLNIALCEGNPRCIFTTLIVGVIDTHKSELTYVNGGHNPPACSVEGKEFVFMDLPPGIVLGIEETASYEMATRQLSVGDTLVFYTDGIVEARNSQQEFYSDERLLAHLTVTKAANPKEFIDGIEGAVHTFADGIPQSDDITVLVLRYGESPD